MNIKSIFVVLLLISQLVGCTVNIDDLRSSQVDCDTILNSPLRTMDYQNLSISETKQFLSNAFPNGRASISHREYRRVKGDFANYDVIKWEENSINYSATLVEGNLIYVEADLNHTNYTTEEAFKCLGKPQYYLAYFGPNEGLAFELWYPEQGITLHSVFADEIKPNINNEVQRIIFSKPETDVYQVKNNIYYVKNPNIDLRMKELLKLWTEQWDTIVVEQLFQ